MSPLEWVRLAVLVAYPLLCLGFDPGDEFILAADDSYTTGGKIVVFDLSGNIVETIDVRAEGYLFPADVTFDYAKQRVYFTDYEKEVVASMKVDGSDITEHGTAESSYGIAIDSTTNTLYWTDSEDDEKLSKISLCPGGTEVQIITGEKDIWDVEVYKGEVYYSVSENARIGKITADGTDVHLITAGLSSAYGMFIDREEEKLYWADGDAGHIARAYLDGSDVEILLADLSFVTDVVVTPQLLLWSEWDDNIYSIRRDNLDGPINVFALYDGSLNGLHHLPRGLRCVAENPSIESRETAVVYGLPHYPDIDVCFQKSDDTGTASSLPPSFVEDVGEPPLGKSLAIPKPPRCPGQRFGVYSCDFDGGSVDADIRTVLRSDGQGTALSPVDGRVTKTASVKDQVVIAVRRPNGGYCNRLIRWRKDGSLEPKWSGKTHVAIKEAAMKDEGIYEVYLRGRRARNKHTTILLYIRACEAGTFGPDCSGTCVCKNGGHCDATTGSCICPPGFRGGSGTCEEVDSTERNYCARVFGPGHSKCQGLLFCLRGKFGCTCAAGYHGLNCDKQCRTGTYGAGCTQRCPRDECCDRFGSTYTCP